MTLEELRRQRHEKARDCRSILNKAEAESRDLARDERSQFDAIDGEIGDIVDRRIAMTGHGDDDEQRSGGVRGPELANLGGGETSQRADFLLGERRFADWQAQRNVRSEFEPDESREFSLGRLVQRMAGRSIGGDELEQRAVAAGADSTGGVLVPDARLVRHRPHLPDDAGAQRGRADRAHGQRRAEHPAHRLRRAGWLAR